MSKTEEEDIYWQNCQSYGVNLSLEGCHLVDKESLANNFTDDDEHEQHGHGVNDDVADENLHQGPLCVE